MTARIVSLGGSRRSRYRRRCWILRRGPAYFNPSNQARKTYSTKTPSRRCSKSKWYQRFGSVIKLRRFPTGTSSMSRQTKTRQVLKRRWTNSIAARTVSTLIRIHKTSYEWRRMRTRRTLLCLRGGFPTNTRQSARSETRTYRESNRLVTLRCPMVPPWGIWRKECFTQA